MQLEQTLITHSSAGKSEGIIAPMVPHKGRICTSPLWQDRPKGEREITPLYVTPFLTARTSGECKSSLRAPQRGAHAPQSHHPALAPLAPILTYVHPVNACPLADKQGRGLASPLKSRTLLSRGHSHGDINRSSLA